jgi:hypothetical protein
MSLIIVFVTCIIVFCYMYTAHLCTCLIFCYMYTPHLCTCLIFCLVGSRIPGNCIQKALDLDSGGNTDSKLPNSLLPLPSPDRDNLSSWSV